MGMKISIINAAERFAHLVIGSWRQLHDDSRISIGSVVDRMDHALALIVESVHSNAKTSNGFYSR